MAAPSFEFPAVSAFERLSGTDAWLVDGVKPSDAQLDRLRGEYGHGVTLRADGQAVVLPMPGWGGGIRIFVAPIVGQGPLLRAIDDFDVDGGYWLLNEGALRAPSHAQRPEVRQLFERLFFEHRQRAMRATVNGPRVALDERMFGARQLIG